jgi:hypothetical protein
MIDHFRVSVNTHPLTAEDIDFREQGTDTGFRSNYLFAVADVIEEIVYYFNNQELSDRMQWVALGRKDR